MSDPALVVAAGAVVLRPQKDGRRKEQSQVLLVHRPKYDDWSFPKGKLDPDESARTAAVREVLEETGVHLRLGPPLTDQAYVYGPERDRTKVVHYWIGHVGGDDDVSAYAPNAEIDEVRWVDVDAAEKLLSYSRDRATLHEARSLGPQTVPLAVLRHAEARDRKKWKKDDRERPLTECGQRQAEALPLTLAAYGIDRLVSSSSRRCWTTLSPYGVHADAHIEVTDALSEEDATLEGVIDEVETLLDDGEPTVLCSHRPVLPMVFEALHLDPGELDLAAMVVVHHRDGRISAIERICSPSVSLD